MEKRASIHTTSLTGTQEGDYTHDFYPGPGFFPHADSWSLSDGKCCTMLLGEPPAKPPSPSPDCHMLLYVKTTGLQDIGSQL